MNVLVIDTETTNSLEQPMPYDVGYAIFNTDFNAVTLKRSFVVAEIFLDKELMAQAYFADKIPQYWDDIVNGKRVLKSICNIRKAIRSDMENYSVSLVGAYNMGFDNRAARNDVRYITGSLVKWFFPYGTKFFCIWNMACSSILQTKSYIEWAIENEGVSDKGNIRTSAEMVYRWLTCNSQFTESHTGLEDVLIEIEILKAVLDSRMDFEDKISYACWRKVTKAARQLGVI